MSRLAIVSDNVPWSLAGSWRLDCGANKTAYERTGDRSEPCTVVMSPKTLQDEGILGIPHWQQVPTPRFTTPRAQRGEVECLKLLI